MIRFFRDLRLLPVALIASACLLALKAADLVFDGGYLMTGGNAPTRDTDVAVIRTTPDMPQTGGPQRSWAQQMFNFPDAGGPVDPGTSSRATPNGSLPDPLKALTQPAAKGDTDITGSVPAPGAEKKAEGTAKDEAVAALSNEGRNGGEGKESKDGGNAPKDGRDSKDLKDAKAGKDLKDAKPAEVKVILTDSPASGAERAILERLQERRQELDRRARELDIREGLLQAAEKRVEARLTELKEVEAQIVTATQQKNEAEAARFKGLVTMYENMKPRDAAKIFDRLEIGVLLQVASQLNPRRMADVLAQMSPETAERLTVELANRAHQPDKNGNDLPKIEGRPTTP